MHRRAGRGRAGSSTDRSGGQPEAVRYRHRLQTKTLSTPKPAAVHRAGAGSVLCFLRLGLVILGYIGPSGGLFAARRGRRSRKSDQNSRAVVNFVLNDLRRKASEGFEPGLEFLVLPLHLDGSEPLRLPGAGKGETALFNFVRTGLL